MRTIENATGICCQIYPSFQNFKAENHIVSHLGAGAKAAAEATRAATIIDLNMMKKRCICGNYVMLLWKGVENPEKKKAFCRANQVFGLVRGGCSACKIKKKGRGKKRKLRFHPFNSNRAFSDLQKMSAIHPPQMV